MQNSLEKRGWQIISLIPGDGYAISASWVIERSNRVTPLYIDFQGLDDMKTLPIEESIGCHIRVEPNIDLYFSKQGQRKSSHRERWKDSLTKFVSQIDELERLSAANEA
ncbi:MAG: hypothetical protein EOP04_08060 [Proteobacteria bacterium]|nr:MAG: hypothetical protein EOP04_08060 [Pseudomonadota bacterium]